MNSTIIIVGILALVFIFLVFGVSSKPLRFIGKALFHVTLGVALLFIVNVVGTYFDFHISMSTKFFILFLFRLPLSALLLSATCPILHL